ncbi:pyruvate kinase, partial [Tanacetum coccineum]
VKLPDGFGSNFKHKVTDNDTNITGLKSHDCHIMMQRLLPYGLQQYLPPDVAKPLIELCFIFKQICSQTLMVDDMLKAQSKVIDILCNLELIYPPAFFDIMIHLVIHLPLEAIFGRPIRPRWMYPFERYMKKLKNYIRNKAKPEGSIAEGYVAEEALTFSSYYFRDVTTKFNHPDRNVDCPPPTCQFQVFKSLCKSIGLRSVIRIDHQELKKVIWYVLHNSPEIDTYRAMFKSEFPDNDMKEAFPGSRDERRTTQNSGICSPGPDGEMYYEDDPDVIHVDNSSDLALSISLNDLEIAALHIDGQLIDVDASRDIIDVVDEDDDIIDEEDPIPHDLANSDDEDLVNLHINDGMSADVARGHGGDGGGDDRPPSHHIPTGCGGCLGNRGKGTRKPNLGGRRAGRQHTRQETRNLRLKAITDKSGPVSIRFEFGDRETLMPFGEHVAHCANYLGELVRELPLHYPSWRQVPAEQKARVMARIGTQFDMRPHMESDRWPLIYAAIQQHLQKIYNGKKAALKERHWIPDSDGTYDLERIRLSRPSHISEVNWDAQIAFWNDPKNRARATQNKQNRAKSKVVCRQGSRSIAALRDMHMESSATREYQSLIHTFFLTHTEEMLRLQGLGSNTETGVPYTEDEIMAIVRGGKQRGHIPGVGRVLPGQGTVIPPPSPCTHSSDVVKLKKREKVLTRQVNMFMKLFRSDDKFSQMLNQLESQPKIGGGSGSGGRGNDEQGDDEDNNDDGEDEDDS